MMNLNRLLVFVFTGFFTAGVFAHHHDTSFFKAKLRGANEIPVPVDTNTRGNALVIVDEQYGEIEFFMSIRNAVGIFGGPGAHIHCGFADQNGPIIAFMAAGLTQGLNGRVKVRGTLTDANILADSGCGTNVSEVLESMRDGRTYINVHSNRNPAGEIRGQLGSRK